MKKYFSLFATMFLAGLWSCDKVEQDLPVVLPKAIVKVATPAVAVNYDLETVENNVCTVNVLATAEEGYEGGEITVSLIPAAEATLASKHYTISSESAVISNGTASFTITFTSAPEDGVYTLPLTLTCKGEEVYADPTADKVTVSLVVGEINRPTLSLVAPETYTEVANGYELTYKVVSNATIIPLGAEYAMNVTVTDKNNAELVEGVDYTVAGDLAFAAGGRENAYVVTVVPVDPALDEVYTINVALDGGVNFEVFNDASTLKLERYPLWDKSGVTEADVEGSCRGDSGTTGPIAVFDGKLNTFWKNQGVSNPVEPSPWLLQLNMKQDVAIHALGIYGRQDVNQRPGACRTGGFRFDNKVTDIEVPAEQCAGNGQWEWHQNLDYVKGLFDVFYNYDYKMTVDGAAAPGGGADALAYYLGPHWVVLDEDVTTSILQWWIISESSWDRPVATVNGSGGNRFSQAAELEIRLGTPSLTVVK